MQMMESAMAMMKLIPQNMLEVQFKVLERLHGRRPEQEEMR